MMALNFDEGYVAARLASSVGDSSEGVPHQGQVALVRVATRIKPIVLIRVFSNPSDTTRVHAVLIGLFGSFVNLILNSESCRATVADEFLIKSVQHWTSKRNYEAGRIAKEQETKNKKMGVIISLPVGITRTLISVVQKFVLRQNKPLRIDLPLPFIPIDVVFVSDASQIVSISTNTDVDRLHGQPTEKLPRWIRWYFSGTRFHNASHDKWFLAFEPQSESIQYQERLQVIKDRLSTGFEHSYVEQIADQLLKNVPEEEIAVTVTRMVNIRFLSSTSNASITPEVVKKARKVLKTNILDAIVPGHQKEGVSAQEATYSFCERNIESGLNVMDGTHTIGAIATPMTTAIMKLKDNPDASIEHLFTRKANCPTPTVPRVVMKETTLNGLLSYQGRPSSTIVFLSISSAAEQTSSLFFTFGSGGEYRSCAFKHFFYDFMTALQAELKARRSEVKN
ncbi:hypothetical protein R1sor_009450 [Riccia sorocarpa]|uniref:O-acyltransferase WSD1 C-terminal domain-containing protein n=1 Tax=Riccia sorocarpa TaxID=122646 RepID=A0ABD3I1A6_9MARC